MDNVVNVRPDYIHTTYIHEEIML